MCHSCVFENGVDHHEVIKKSEKEDLENRRVNANTIKKYIVMDDIGDKQYIDFLIKINNHDIDDYVLTLKNKYGKILDKFRILLQRRYDAERQSLNQLAERNDLEVITCPKTWRELKSRCERGGDDDCDILAKCTS